MRPTVADTLPFGKDARPEYPETEARGKLSRKDRARLCLKQAGKCAGCGVKPLYGWEFDHIIELWEGGTNHISNWQAFGSRRDCKCHAVKTAEAARRRAKMHRLRGNTGQVKRRKARGGSSIKSAGKLQSAGFQKGLRKRMSGKVERIET